MPVLEDVRLEASGCTRCALASGRTQVVFGEGNPRASLMVVGEAPGADEDKQGRPFVGRSGQLLDRLLWEELGVARADVYIANVIKCRPPNNRDPEPAEIAECSPWLSEQLAIIGARVLLPLGNFATRFLLGTKKGIRSVRGEEYPYPGREGVVVVPTFHPAAALRSRNDTLPLMRADFVRAKRVLERNNEPLAGSAPPAGSSSPGEAPA